MQKQVKTLHVEMLLNDQGDWAAQTFETPSVVAGPAKNGSRPRKKTEVEKDEEASLDAFSRLLSRRNVELLRLIKREEPKSVAELSRLSGRPKASLMLTLKRLKKYGIVEFVDAGGRRKVPRLACERLRLDIPIV